MKTGPTTDQAERFLELLQPIEAELEAYCRRLIWDSQEVQDALHNSLARAIGAFDRYHEDTHFRAWMYKILTREVFALNRKHQRLSVREYQMEPEEMALLAEDSPASAPATEREVMKHWQDWLDQNLVFALQTLTEPERATLLLRGVGGFTYQEIAQALDMPLGSVVGYLGRARKKMRLALARQPFKQQKE